MAGHNIFADTALGGTLSFLAAPAAVTPAALLGYDSALNVGSIPPASIHTFLGISGTEWRVARFGANNSIVNSAMVQSGSGTASSITTDGSFVISEFLLFPKRTAPGNDPSKLSLMLTETTTVVFVAAPTDFSGGKNYYPKLSSTGISWTEGVPDGGGEPTGVGGSGTADYVAKWRDAGNLTESLITCSTNATVILSSLTIRPTGSDVFAVAATAWQILATVMPDYGAVTPTANCRVMLWDESTAVKRADAARARAWLQVYSQGEVNTIVAGYLPLTGGTLTGPLQISADNPRLAQKTAVGNGIAYWTNGDKWLLYVTDQGYALLHSALEYNFTDGDFRVHQWNGSAWQSLAVATQAWVDLGYSPRGHVHTTVPEITNAALGGGSASGTTVLHGDRQWKTVTGGGTGTVTSVTVAATSPLESVGSPINAGNPSGTITVRFPSQNAHAFLCGPSSGTTGAVSFRPIDFSDITDAALGNSGTANSTTFLCGNRTWQVPPSGIPDTSSSPAGALYARKYGEWTRIDGTVNYIPKWASGPSMANSILSELSGTIYSAGSLDVSGSIYASGDISIDGNFSGGGVNSSVYAPIMSSDTLYVGGVKLPDMPYNRGASFPATTNKLYALKTSSIGTNDPFGNIWQEFTPGGGGVDSWIDGSIKPAEDSTKAYVLVWNDTTNKWNWRELVGTGTAFVAVS